MNPVLLLAFIGISTLLLASMLNIGDLNNASNEFLLQTLQQESYKTQEFVSATYDNNNNKVIVASNIPTTIVKYYVVDQNNNNIKSTQTLNLDVNGVSTFTIPNVSSTDKVYILTSQGNTYVVTQQTDNNNNNVRCQPNQNFTYMTRNGNANINIIQPCIINVQLTSNLSASPEYASNYYSNGDTYWTSELVSPDGFSYVVMKIDLPAGNYSLNLTKDTLSYVFIAKSSTIDLTQSSLWIRRGSLYQIGSLYADSSQGTKYGTASCIWYYYSSWGNCTFTESSTSSTWQLTCRNPNTPGRFPQYYDYINTTCVDSQNNQYYFVASFGNGGGCIQHGWDGVQCSYRSATLKPSNAIDVVYVTTSYGFNISTTSDVAGKLVYASWNYRSYSCSSWTITETQGYKSVIGSSNGTTIHGYGAFRSCGVNGSHYASAYNITAIPIIPNGFIDFGNQLVTLPVQIQGNEKLYVLYVNPYTSCTKYYSYRGYDYGWQCGNIKGIPDSYFVPSTSATSQKTSQTTQMQLVITRQ
jgi:hypothetical protein